MRLISPALSEHLAGTNVYLLADLFTVRVGGRNGTTVYDLDWWDVDITHDGHVFSSVGPGIERGKTRQAQTSKWTRLM